jgi:hypothetical protein
MPGHCLLGACSYYRFFPRSPKDHIRRARAQEGLYLPTGHRYLSGRDQVPHRTFERRARPSLAPAASYWHTATQPTSEARSTNITTVKGRSDYDCTREAYVKVGANLSYSSRHCQSTQLARQLTTSSWTRISRQRPQEGSRGSTTSRVRCRNILQQARLLPTRLALPPLSPTHRQRHCASRTILTNLINLQRHNRSDEPDHLLPQTG